MRTRRRHERFIRRLETEFIGHGKTYRAISSDFSRYGLFIRTNHAFTPGTELDIVVHLPAGGDARLKGIVRRAMKTPIVSLKNGMGIELIKRDQNYIKFLKNFDPTETGDEAVDSSTLKQAPSPKPAEEKAAAPAESVIIACASCGAKNRILKEKLIMGPKCGKCRNPLIISA